MRGQKGSLCPPKKEVERLHLQSVIVEILELESWCHHFRPLTQSREKVRTKAECRPAQKQKGLTKIREDIRLPVLRREYALDLWPAT